MKLVLRSPQATYQLALNPRCGAAIAIPIDSYGAVCSGGCCSLLESHVTGAGRARLRDALEGFSC